MALCLNPSNAPQTVKADRENKFVMYFQNSNFSIYFDTVTERLTFL